MTKSLILAAVLAAAFSANAIADESDRERCASYAKEDGIGADEMDNYMAECLASLQSNDNESADEPRDEEPTPKDD